MMARRCRRWPRSPSSRGLHLGRALVAHLRDGAAMPPFHFHNRGNTAIIGGHAAVFDFGWMQLKGRIAWFLWALIHVALLVGFENRLRVTLRRAWRYVTYEAGARLILS
jgi:NADH:ubiquinone reductase (H+-translocating)